MQNKSLLPLFTNFQNLKCALATPKSGEEGGGLVFWMNCWLFIYLCFTYCSHNFLCSNCSVSGSPSNWLWFQYFLGLIFVWIRFTEYFPKLFIVTIFKHKVERIVHEYPYILLLASAVVSILPVFRAHLCVYVYLCTHPIHLFCCSLWREVVEITTLHS